eukprot:6075287-Prymnesium_polylepis.1
MKALRERRDVRVSAVRQLQGFVRRSRANREVCTLHTLRCTQPLARGVAPGSPSVARPHGRCATHLVLRPRCDSSTSVRAPRGSRCAWRDSTLRARGAAIAPGGCCSSCARERFMSRAAGVGSSHSLFGRSHHSFWLLLVVRATPLFRATLPLVVCTTLSLIVCATLRHVPSPLASAAWRLAPQDG